jgi:integrase
MQTDHASKPKTLAHYTNGLNRLLESDRLLPDVATIIVDGGMRPEEVFRMRWENVHFEPAGNARFGRIFNPFGKTENARRNVSMTQRMRALLEMRHEQQEKPAQGWVFPAATKTGRVESLKSQHRKGSERVQGEAICLVLAAAHDAHAPGRSWSRCLLNSENCRTLQHCRFAALRPPHPKRLENAFAALETYNAVQQEKLNAGVTVQ